MWKSSCSRIKMILFPGVVLCALIFGTCLGEISGVAGSTDDDAPNCPGRCVTDGDRCNVMLNETDCDSGSVCCLDHLDKSADTDISDWDVTTLDSLQDFVDEQMIAEPSDESSIFPENEDSEDVDFTSGPEYVTLYSEEPETTDSPLLNRQQFDETLYETRSDEDEEQTENCPGACIPRVYSEYCEYIVDSDELCAHEMTCCVTEEQAYLLGDEREINLVEKPILLQRSSEFDIDERCPGTCMHQSHVMYCERIIEGYKCPLNAKCCIKTVAEKLFAGKQIIPCTGQCLPVNMRGYCIPPNELIVSQTTCSQNTVCCMRRSVTHMEPSINKSPPSQFQVSADTPNFLGHLAIDDADNIFKVAPNGHISPLPRLTPEDHLHYFYTKVSSFDRSNGEVVVYADSNGVLYQQFHERRPQSSFFPQSSRKPQQPPLFRQPILQFESQASEHAATFQVTDDGISNKESLVHKANIDAEDIVIPEDDDEVPTTSTPKPSGDLNTLNRPCPGSCMSYFLRFTCFRGYAIYDGFSCPGRSVCCAKLKDIEDHEEYLKSLSPYFNAPPSSRDPNLPRCGIKGRRDTPRVMGGKDSLPGEWCWQVAIINMQNQYICGGALIDDSWVLTAAHCVVGPIRESQALFVRVGVTDLKSPEDNSKGQTVRVLSTFIHHNFNNMNLDNDIALLRLQKPVELGPNVCVICLPTSGQMPKENTKCVVTGYGFVSAGGDMSLKIREAKVPIVDDMDCMTNVTEALTNPFILPASSFCAGGHGQQDACQGDAGGPLACEVGGFHELVGLVSWGLGCGRSDVPSIYVKVPSFMGWINQIISSSSFLMSLN